MLDNPREAAASWFGEHMTAAELADVARYVGELEHAGSMLGELAAVLALARRRKRRQAREALMARRVRLRHLRAIPLRSMMARAPQEHGRDDRALTG
jgi:hypothetical protein